MTMSVSSVSTSTTSTTSSSTSALTSAQKETIDKLLSNYDSDNFTTSDSEKLLSELSDAGISVNSTVLSYLKKSGFDVLNADSSSSTLASVLSGGSSTESVSSLLEKYQNGELTESELRAELLAQMPTYTSTLSGSSSSSSGSLLNVLA